MTRPVQATRRALLLFAFGASACRKPDASAPERCSNCGMKIDGKSPWRTLLVADGGAEKAFDTPRCALAAWRRGRVPASRIRVQEFYDRAWVDGEAVRFVIGSDVTGPMGPDLVPVEPSRAEKFLKDHEGKQAVTLAGVTVELIEAVR